MERIQMTSLEYIMVGSAVAALTYLVIAILIGLTEYKNSRLVSNYFGYAFLIVGMFNMGLAIVHFCSMFFDWYIHAASQLF